MISITILSQSLENIIKKEKEFFYIAKTKSRATTSAWNS